MKWVGIRLETELGDGVVFVRNPFVLAGVEPPGTRGSLKIRIGDRVRFAPGVIIEAEPGRDSLLDIGAGTRIGANTHIQLRGGSIRIGPRSEIRDHCVLKTSGGEIDMGELCFMSYGSMVHSTERIVMEDRVGTGERVSLVDSDHESDGGETHWKAHDLAVAPIVVRNNTLLMANSVITQGAEIGANSQVAAGAVVRAGEYEDSVLLAGAPARVVKHLDED
jgi:acetyltransferase-like isoleucine patch superfamily enzyme